MRRRPRKPKVQLAASYPSEADRLKDAVGQYYTSKRHAVHLEVGLCKRGRLRADVLTVTMGSQITLLEVKSSVADFKSDKKYTKYLQFCDKMYFVVSTEVYEKIKDLIPSSIGVIAVYPSGLPRVKRRAVTQELTVEQRLAIITRLAYKSADRSRYNLKSKFEARIEDQVSLVVTESLKNKLPKSEIRKVYMEVKASVTALVNKD